MSVMLCTQKIFNCCFLYLYIVQNIKSKSTSKLLTYCFYCISKLTDLKINVIRPLEDTRESSILTLVLDYSSYDIKAQQLARDTFAKQSL